LPGRALLIGVPDYSSEAITDLTFVSNDLSSLSDALGNVGYEVSLLGGPGEGSPTHNSIIHRVYQFCRHGVQDGEVAVLYFSGHGLHYKGRDYLVPADATLGDELIEQVMVPLDFAAAYEQSRASAIFFFVDACRDGIDLGEKGSLGYQQWSQGKRETVRHQQAAYIFSCGPGEVSRFVPGEDGFSLFSRALSDTLLNCRPESTLTFGRVSREVQRRVDELADKYEKKRQSVRIIAESGSDDSALMSVQISAGGLRSTTAHFGAVGFDIEMIGDELITGDDLKLFSHNVDGKPPWIEGSIPTTHILRAGAALDMPIELVGQRLRTFEPVGISVPEIDSDAAAGILLDHDDLILLPSAGGVPTEAGTEVPAVHVLYAASKLNLPADKVLGRLNRFSDLGVTLPEIDPKRVKGLMVSDQDLLVLSANLDGRPPWLQGDVSVFHILQAANQLDQPVGTIVKRLERFEACGVRASLPSDNISENLKISEEDLKFLSEDLDGQPPWVDSPVPVGHILYAANDGERPIGSVINCLKRLEPIGIQLPAVNNAAAALTVSDDDLAIVSRDFDGLPPWLEGSIPGSRILAASNHLDRPVSEVVTRLQKYDTVGLRLPEVDMKAIGDMIVSDADMVLLNGDYSNYSALQLGDTIPVAHILYAANYLDESVDDALKRVEALAAVGLNVSLVDRPGVKDLRVSDEDLKLLSRRLDGGSPWLERRITWFHLLRAANRLDEPLDQILDQVSRFQVVGYEVPAFDAAAVKGLKVSEKDLTVLSRDLDADEPWVGQEELSIIHLLRASARLGETIGAVRKQLQRFAPVGIELPPIYEDDVLKLVVTDDDLLLLSEKLDASAPWIDAEVPIAHVLLAASEREEDIGSVLGRFAQFRGLGIDVPTVDQSAARLTISREDLVLLSRDLDAQPPWMSQEMPTIHLLRAASELEEPVRETLNRLHRLESVNAVRLMPYFTDVSRFRRRRAFLP
jgi:hypothetical protein